MRYSNRGSIKRGRQPANAAVKGAVARARGVCAPQPADFEKDSSLDEDFFTPWEAGQNTPARR